MFFGGVLFTENNEFGVFSLTVGYLLSSLVYGNRWFYDSNFLSLY